MARPLELAARLAWYIASNKLRGRKRFPLVTMLEPLEKCNLACEGCGRIREYEPVLDRMLSVEECIEAVEDSGAPIVSIAGGEPTLHPQIHEIVNRIVERKRFVYMCTNALLMERVMKKIPPTKYFCFVVHLDGMEEAHDRSVYRKGVFRIATRAIRAALDSGHRVTTNTTVFNGVDEDDVIEMFKMVTGMGVEGAMVSPGYQFEMIPNQDLFISRGERAQGVRERSRPQARNTLLQQPAVLGLSAGRARISVRGLVEPHLHGDGMARAVLPARRPPHEQVRRSDVGRAVGALRSRQRSAMRQLHDALRVRVRLDIRRAVQSEGRIQDGEGRGGAELRRGRGLGQGEGDGRAGCGRLRSGRRSADT